MEQQTKSEPLNARFDLDHYAKSDPDPYPARCAYLWALQLYFPEFWYKPPLDKLLKQPQDKWLFDVVLQTIQSWNERPDLKIAMRERQQKPFCFLPEIGHGKTIKRLDAETPERQYRLLTQWYTFPRPPQEPFQFEWMAPQLQRELNPLIGISEVKYRPSFEPMGDYMDKVSKAFRKKLAAYTRRYEVDGIYSKRDENYSHYARWAARHASGLKYEDLAEAEHEEVTTVAKAVQRFIEHIRNLDRDESRHEIEHLEAL